MRRPPGVASAVATMAVVATACGTAADVPVGAAPPPATATVTPSPTAPPAPPPPSGDATVGPTSEGLPRLGPAPTLTGLDGWLQNDGVESLDDLAGQVVVLQFWTFGCINCKNTLPHLSDLAAEHAADDVTVVGVHSPEFEYEKDPRAIQAAATELGVTWPIALDTDKTSFRDWQGDRRFWPRTYVIDQTGQIRFDRIGEGAYQALDDAVAALLADPPG